MKGGKKAMPNWENIAIYSLQAGMTMKRLHTVLQATLPKEPTKEEWQKVGQIRKQFRPQLRRLGFKF